MPRNYSCMEVCGMPKHCGNKYCSNHPKYVPPAPKKRKKNQQEQNVATVKPMRFRDKVAKKLCFFTTDTSGSMR